METDTLPLRLLHQTGVGSTDMLTMFKVLQKQASSLLESISIHTDMSSTLEKLEILIEQNPNFVSNHVLSKKSWESLQNICQKFFADN